MVGGCARACGEVVVSKAWAHQPWGTETCAQALVGACGTACGEAAVSKARAHYPGGTGSPAKTVVGEGSTLQGPGTPARGDGESGLGGGRRVLKGLRGRSNLQGSGTRAWGDGVVPSRWSARLEGRAGRQQSPRPGHTTLGGREPCSCGGRRVLKRLRGGTILKARAHICLGGRGVVPRRWSARPQGLAGRQQSPRPGHTILGGVGSPAQAVVGASRRACAEAAVSRAQAHPHAGTKRPAHTVVGAS